MPPLQALNKLAADTGGLSYLAHRIGYTKQNLYKLRDNLIKNPDAEVPPAMAATLAYFASTQKIDVDFGDFCPSIAKAAHGQFPARFVIHHINK